MKNKLNFLKLISFFIFIFVGHVSFAMAQNSKSQMNGSVELHDEKFSSLQVNGSLGFQNLNIKDSLEVNGSLKGKNLQCKNLTVNGSSRVTDLKATNLENNGSFSGQNLQIQNDMTVHGSIEAKNINIFGNAKVYGGVMLTDGDIKYIQITAQNATFIHSNIGSIFFKKSKSGLEHDQPQVLELKSGSVVSGDVVFESEGIIHLFENSIIQGKVVGAKVVKK